GAGQAEDPHGYWAARRRHYQDASVADGYDARRFHGARARRNRAKGRAIERALDRAGSAGDVRDVLDIPTGTGRFVSVLLGRGHAVVAADISREMMTVAE